MVKLHVISKEGIWYGILSTPDGAMRMKNKQLGKITNQAKSICRESNYGRLVIFNMDDEGIQW